MAVHLSHADCTKGIADLHELLSAVSCNEDGLQAKLTPNSHLSLIRALKKAEDAAAAAAADEPSGQETNRDNPQQTHESEDEERLVDPRRGSESSKTLQQTTAAVVYDIIHSVSYGVPVLYFHFQQDGHDRAVSPPKLETLIPAIAKAQVQNVGVMGAISMTEHPVTGRMVYFVHPCRTAEAMGHLGARVDMAGVDYLLLWLGVVGCTVGLSLPATALARRVANGGLTTSDNVM